MQSRVNLTFLHPSGLLSLFKYPEQDVHSVPLKSILTLVDPQTRTGHVIEFYQQQRRSSMLESRNRQEKEAFVAPKLTTSILLERHRLGQPFY